MHTTKTPISLPLVRLLYHRYDDVKKNDLWWDWLHYSTVSMAVTYMILPCYGIISTREDDTEGQISVELAS